ncbi:hypothetical protein Trydic_g1391 [Trypoxylus dichotomus]
MRLVTQAAHLVCYVLDHNIIFENFLFCKNIIGSAKAEDLFEIPEKFITDNDFEWDKCIGKRLHQSLESCGVWEKVIVWIRKINEDGGKHCFLELHKYVACNKVAVSPDLFLIKEHFSKLTGWVAKYFEENNVEKFAWI